MHQFRDGVGRAELGLGRKLWRPINCGSKGPKKWNEAKTDKKESLVLKIVAGKALEPGP